MTDEHPFAGWRWLALVAWLLVLATCPLTPIQRLSLGLAAVLAVTTVVSIVEAFYVARTVNNTVLGELLTALAEAPGRVPGDNRQGDSV